ncbi:MAG: hypothetical protein V9H69_19915 [Anaerolineae bacterium]
MQHLRQLYPDLLAPDFPGDFWQRMARLEQVIGATAGWTIVGSSMGGLMAASLCLPASGPGGQAGAAGSGAGLHRPGAEPAAAQRCAHGDLSRPAGRRGAAGENPPSG